MLMHAFLNIYLNAIDAMEIGGHLSLTAELVQNGERFIRIEITDNGCGIDEADILQLFNPFFTRKQYGTGLGLTHVKKFVDLHHGNIEITSKKGEGTKVVVTLPLEEKTGSPESPMK
jgi:signal transduction histidine kinase